MMRFSKILFTATFALLASVISYAQPPHGGSAPNPPKDFDKNTKAADTVKRATIIENKEEVINFPTDAPMLNANDNRLYYLRKVNFHGSSIFDPAVLEIGRAHV